MDASWTVLLAVPVMAAFAALVLRRFQPELAMGIALLAGIGLLTVLLTRAQPVIATIGGMLGAAGLPREFGEQIFKAMGVCLLTQLSADACRDAGENGLASKAELVGRVALLITALPLFEQVAQTASSLIGGGS